MSKAVDHILESSEESRESEPPTVLKKRVSKKHWVKLPFQLSSTEHDGQQPQETNADEPKSSRKQSEDVIKGTLCMDPAKIRAMVDRPCPTTLCKSQIKEVVPMVSCTFLLYVDHFYKACNFVEVPKLPSAKGTAEFLLQHVVRIHGMPSDLVSDQGPQFISHFWKAFCWLMGASVSLYSSFHPESNSQTERVNQDLAQTLQC
ncbi:hypothetical protein SRHO_G00103640 [Serrasalmus rhombeus]